MKNEPIGIKLFTLTHIIKRNIDKTTCISDTMKNMKHNCEFTSSNMQIIRFLYNNKDKEIYQKDIESYFSLTAPTVSANLKLMEKNGLIKRQYSAKDTRLKIVMLTEKAIKMESMIRNHMKSIEKKFNHALTDEEQKQLSVLLDKIKAEFE